MIPSCIICGGATNHHQQKNTNQPNLPVATAVSGLCTRCSAKIPWITDPRCRWCGRAVPCGDCLRRRKRYLMLNRAAVEYTRDMKEWLARYKYRGDERLAPLFGWMLEHAYHMLRQELMRRDICIHGITYVPLSPLRLRDRGFNQAEQLARYLGSRFRLPVVSMLERTVHTGKQSFKTRAERIGDMVHAFAVRTQAAAVVKPGMCLIIVDDVYTTGSTLHQCAKALRDTCRINCFGLTWAR